MTRQEWYRWIAVVAVLAALLLWHETRTYTQCRAQYSVAQCDAWLIL